MSSGVEEFLNVSVDFWTIKKEIARDVSASLDMTITSSRAASRAGSRSRVHAPTISLEYLFARPHRDRRVFQKCSAGLVRAIEIADRPAFRTEFSGERFLRASALSVPSQARPAREQSSLRE